MGAVASNGCPKFVYWNFIQGLKRLLYKLLNSITIYFSGTIVENTTEGLNRDLKFYQNVSRASNVHIVAGTGHYIADLQSGDTLQKSTEDVYNHMLQELTKGCVNFEGVKAGFMGEIASVWPLRGKRKRVNVFVFTH